MYSSNEQKQARKPVTVSTLAKMKREAEKIVMLTAYDASFAALCDNTGVDIILVGDSLGMVMQGLDSTIPVTVDEMVYHTKCVCSRAHKSFVIADMPFMSYNTAEDAAKTAASLMKDGGAQMVKLEGGEGQIEKVRFLTSQGVPVCGHLGLLPQSVHKIGGYMVQGRGDAQAQAIINEAKSLEEAGADILVLECVPAELAKRVTESVAIPVIGIGAGINCDGQVLVLQDMLGITPGKKPKFSKNFMEDAFSIEQAIDNYVNAVKAKEFPAPEHNV